jgi:hypothetical protein
MEPLKAKAGLGHSDLLYAQRYPIHNAHHQNQKPLHWHNAIWTSGAEFEEDIFRKNVEIELYHFTISFILLNT